MHNVEIEYFFCHSDFTWNQKVSILQFWMLRMFIFASVPMKLGLGNCSKTSAFEIATMFLFLQNWFHVKSDQKEFSFNFHIVSYHLLPHYPQLITKSCVDDHSLEVRRCYKNNQFRRSARHTVRESQKVETSSKN